MDSVAVSRESVSMSNGSVGKHVDTKEHVGLFVSVIVVCNRGVALHF